MTGSTESTRQIDQAAEARAREHGHHAEENERQRKAGAQNRVRNEPRQSGQRRQTNPDPVTDEPGHERLEQNDADQRRIPGADR
jgi:hypothetical protein